MEYNQELEQKREKRRRDFNFRMNLKTQKLPRIEIAYLNPEKSPEP